MSIQITTNGSDTLTSKLNFLLYVRHYREFNNTHEERHNHTQLTHSYTCKL